jgi:hypothetical protein
MALWLLKAGETHETNSFTRCATGKITNTHGNFNCPPPSITSDPVVQFSALPTSIKYAVKYVHEWPWISCELKEKKCVQLLFEN